MKHLEATYLKNLQTNLVDRLLAIKNLELMTQMMLFKKELRKTTQHKRLSHLLRERKEDQELKGKNLSQLKILTTI